MSLTGDLLGFSKRAKLAPRPQGQQLGQTWSDVVRNDLESPEAFKRKRIDEAKQVGPAFGFHIG